ncbi:hypothetical protein CHS0354_041356 [Potamilus streckersoni]|uniref:Uncharacterized protein n=1 Tax=Potamilus streckersoni TaxID=2493646 RepID=A0AAE0WAM8_9BIVA|nr:hypothetical protein CHS0354_041356 [Potamilus streckersoni]
MNRLAKVCRKGKARLGGFELASLPPEVEPEIFYEEPVASSASEEEESSETDSYVHDILATSKLRVASSASEEEESSETDSVNTPGFNSLPPEVQDAIFYKEIEEDDKRNENLTDTSHSDIVDGDFIGTIERQYPLTILKLYAVPEIYVELPCGYDGPLDLEALPTSNEEKNEEMEKMPQEIKDRCMLLGTSDRSEMFKFKGKKFDFQDACKITIKFSGKDISQDLDFYAVIKQNGVWNEIPAELTKDNKVTFKCRRMDYFYIVSCPKTTVTELKRNSSHTYVHQSNPQTSIHFPEGSVENDTQIIIKVVPVTKERLEVLNNVYPNPIIKNMSSDVVSVHMPELKELQKPATLQLHVEENMTSEEYKTLLFTIEGDQAIVSEENVNDIGSGTYSCELRKINKCGLIQIVQPLDDRSLNMEAVKEEFLVAINEATPCRVVTFINQQNNRVRTEIVKIANRRIVHYSLKQQEYVCLAEDVPVITLGNGHKVQAHLSGAIRCSSASNSLGFFVIFQTHGENNYMEFDFELHDRNATDHHGKIRYYTGNFKREIHTLHFNPRRLQTSIVTRENLSLQRSKTMTDHLIAATPRQATSRRSCRSPPLSRRSALSRSKNTFSTSKL